MASDYELAKTFFPETRKEIITQAVTLLETKAGEKRMKLLMVMPLEDDKLVGMPTWIGDSYDVICKDGSLLSADKWSHAIKDMTLNTFATDDGERVKHLISAPLLNNFTLQRGKRGEEDDSMPEIYLQFVAYVVASQPLWTWFYEKRGQSIYIRFETTQKELPLAEDKQLKLGDDGYEDARREATSKAHDPEFAQA